MIGYMSKNRNVNQLALDRIGILYDMAGRKKVTDPLLSKRYIIISESIGKKMDITLPRYVKRSYCKKCKMLYSTADKIRLKKGLITITCSKCGNVRRIPYKL